MWDLWWTKWHWGRFSPSTSVFLANSHSTNCSRRSTSIVSGCYNWPVSGWRTKWVRSHAIPRNWKEKLHGVLVSLACTEQAHYCITAVSHSNSYRKKGILLPKSESVGVRVVQLKEEKTNARSVCSDFRRLIKQLSVRYWNNATPSSDNMSWPDS
jgi:hypothetical protein